MHVEETILKIINEDAAVVTGPTVDKPLDDPNDYAKDVKQAPHNEPHATADETKKALGTDDAEAIANKFKKAEAGEGVSKTLESILADLDKEITEDSKKPKAEDEEDDDDDEDDDGPDVKESAGAEEKKEPVTEETVESAEPDALTEEEIGEDLDEDVTADIHAIFGDKKLSESAKNKAATVFKAALLRKSKSQRKKFAELAGQKLKSAYSKLKKVNEQQMAAFEKQANERVDASLKLVSEQWMKENRVAVEKGIRTQIAESFITELKGVFERHYIDIPQAKVDVVKHLGEKVSGLESKLNEALEANIELRKSVTLHEKKDAIQKAAAGLTDVQRDKLAKLAEDVQYQDIKEFTEKLTDLKESYFRKASGKQPGPLNEDAVPVPKNLSKDMELYTSFASQSKSY